MESSWLGAGFGTRPAGWDARLAFWISQIGSPPVMALVGLWVAARATGSPHVWWWVGLYLLLAVLGPVLSVVVMVHRGRVSDLDLQYREQRTWPILITITGLGVAWIISWLGSAPQLLVIMAGGSFVQMVVILVVTMRWKISMHSASAAGMAILVWNVLGPAALPLVVGVPVIAWSRIRLKRHTPAQTLAGMVLGATVFLLAFALAKL